jgi:hypothetical protein
MSERTRGILLLIAVLLLGSVLYRVVGSSVAPLLVFAVTSALNVFRARRREHRQTLDSLLSHLRSLGQDERLAALDTIAHPTLRAYVEAALARDGSDERVGDVERFPFSRAERRRADVTYWIGWGVAVASLAWAALGDMARVWRAAILVPAAVGGLVAWAAARRQRRYSSVLEVTPFRLTEEWPDGLRRTVMFNRYLELENEPAQKRVILRPGGAGSEGIAIDYDRLGFRRLMELVVAYGGFAIEKDESPAT